MIFPAVRIFVLVLAIAATLCVSTASASPAHCHTNSSPNGCNICFTAHTAAFEAPASQLFRGPEPGGQTMALLPFPDYQEHVSHPSSSRGPPPSSC